MKGFTITAIVLLAMSKVCGAGALTINDIQPFEKAAQDSVPKKTFNTNKNFLGTAPLGIILSRPRVQYERQPGKVGIGGIYTRYDGTWRGDKIEPFARLYLNSQSALRMFLHLQVGVGRYRIPYTKVTTVGADSGFEFPNYEIRKHTLSYGTGVGFGAKLVTKKDFFFDLCVRHQYYELASQNPITVEKDNATHTYYPSRGNGFFRATGPGAEWVCSFVLGWAL